MLSRRHFIATSAVAGSQILMNNLQSMATPMKSPGRKANFRLLIFATNWGYSGTWQEFAARIKQYGYDGAELWYPNDVNERRDLISAFQNEGLQLGFLVGSGEKDFQKHLAQFQRSLEGAAAERPVYINCHSGRDYFSFDQNTKFIDLTTRVSKASGVPVYHETHRSRILYSAPVAKQYIQSRPDLRITFDVSHWCNVHESLLADQEETVAEALRRVDHIHARIGHPEGPQVNDPRAPEWKDALEAHFAWWDVVVANKRKEGALMTFLTEFGPVDYMPSLPYTRQPVADQWQINKYMLDTLRERYS
ncbi:MAG TPA: sugar phosphate isomerase/epimerase [Chryseosolibacter sp.]|nr:sugar phosphate isomerase/epimerase [Chryseosolibacter sp.]